MWGDCKVTQLVSGGAGMQTQVSLSPEPVPRHLSAALLDSTAWPGIAPCLLLMSLAPSCHTAAGLTLPAHHFCPSV